MKKLFLIPFLLLGLMVHGQDSTITKVSLKGRMFSIVGTGGTTDLQYNAEERAVESSTGNSAVLPLATTSAHGLMDFTDKIKIGLITLSGAIDLDALSTSVMDKEDTSNKATSLASPDNTKYPTTLAVSISLSEKMDQSSLVDDDTFASPSATTVPSTGSVKAYVDANAGTAGLDQEVAIPKTLGIADAWKIFKNTGTTDVTYTIPTQANEAFTEDIAYTFWVGDTGKIFVKGQTGAGVPAREISTVEKYATLTRFGADNWTWGGTTLAWVPPVEEFEDLGPTGYWNADDLSNGTINEWADRTTSKKFITLVEDPLVETRLDGKKEVSFANTIQASMVGESNWPEIDINFITDNYTFIIQTGDNIPTRLSRYFLFKGEFPSKQFSVSSNSSGTNLSLYVSGTQNQLSEWIDTMDDDFIVFVKNGPNVDVFRNDVLSHTFELIEGPDSMSAFPWGLSNRPGAPFAESQDWSIRKLVFYDKILTPTELTTLYNARND